MAEELYTTLDRSLYKIQAKDETSRQGQADNADPTLFSADNFVEHGQFKRITIHGVLITISPGEDLQKAINKVSQLGGGKVLIANGTYRLNTDLLIPGNVYLEGAARDNVLIDCNSAYSIKILGSNAYNTGTVTIASGATVVVGTGTTWTSSMVGQHIQLDRIWYSITGFTDATHLTIGSSYQNDDLAGDAYTIATLNTNAGLKNVTVTNSTLAGVKLQYTMETIMDNLVIYGCGTGIDIKQSVYPRLIVSSVENGINLDMTDVGGFYIDFCLFANSTTGAGIVMVNSGDATMFNSSVSANTGDGINITNCNKIAFISVTVNLNGGQGIEFVSGNYDNQLTNMIIDGNTSDGVKLTATTDRVAISAVASTNNGGWGFNIANANCDNNILTGVNTLGNTSGAITDSGTGTLKSATVNSFV